MRLSAWRIVTKEFQAAAFTGEGASRYPGRWNGAGVRMVYAAGSISLAILEMLVHLREATVLPDYRLLEVQFDPLLLEVLETNRLPRNWRRDPPPARLHQIGDDWIRSHRSMVLQVPSAITEEPNYLFNLAHRDSGKVRIGPPRKLVLDGRLLPESLASTAKTKQRRG